MGFFQKVETAVNRLSDQGWNWWPFLALRPEQHELYSWKLVLLFSTFGSLLAHAFVQAVRHLLDSPLRIEVALPIQGLCFISGLVLFYITAKCWNLRAGRLKREMPGPPLKADPQHGRH